MRKIQEESKKKLQAVKFLQSFFRFRLHLAHKKQHILETENKLV